MVEKYNDSHFKVIREWYQNRGINFHDKSILPTTGFIVPGKAAGFVYSTDSSICFLEGYVTNPKIRLRDATEALDQITAAVIKWASSNKYKFIKCETKFNGIKRKAKKFGFSSLGNVFSLVRDI